MIQNYNFLPIKVGHNYNIILLTKKQGSDIQKTNMINVRY